MTEIRATNSPLDRYQMPALIAGVVCLALCVLGLLVSGKEQFFKSYLVAFIFWWGLTMGTFGLLMLQHMVGGGWGLATRRCLEAGTSNIFLMLLFFLPLLAGLGALYGWTQPGYHPPKLTTEFRDLWLRPSTFFIRALIYFGIWLLLSFPLLRWSIAQDRSADPLLIARMKQVAAPGLVLFGLTVTFAVIDWVMSIDAHWYSTIYGLIFIAGFGLSALTLMILTLGTLRRTNEPFARIAAPNIMYDLGNLSMAFTMLWAYMSFAQLLIMWSGNTQEDAMFYFHRGIAAVGATGGPYKTPENAIAYNPGGWQYVSTALLIFHFFVPFGLLLARINKRNVSTLMKIAAFILLMRAVDIFWHIVPMFSQNSYHAEPHQPTPLAQGFSWMMPVALVGIGGVWLWAYIGRIKKHPLVPLNDPRLLEVAHSHGH